MISSSQSQFLKKIEPVHICFSRKYLNCGGRISEMSFLT